MCISPAWNCFGVLFIAMMLLSSFRSVFFRGQIERPASSLLSNILGNADVPVRVAINRERVHVIDDNKNVCTQCYIPIANIHKTLNKHFKSNLSVHFFIMEKFHISKQPYIILFTVFYKHFTNKKKLT